MLNTHSLQRATTSTAAAPSTLDPRPSTLRPRPPAPAFTLVELLVVVAIIAILAAMLLPAMARAKQKAQTSNCISNLKQAGVALEMYAQDHDETLPGPVWVGARASYDQDSNTEIIFYLANYLGNPAPGPESHIAEVFVCPGYRSSAPE